MITQYKSKTSVDHLCHRQVGLTFAKPPEWKNWQEYIDTTHDSSIARQITDEVFTNMEPLLEQVFYAI